MPTLHKKQCLWIHMEEKFCLSKCLKSGKENRCINMDIVYTCLYMESEKVLQGTYSPSFWTSQPSNALILY